MNKFDFTVKEERIIETRRMSLIFGGALFLMLILPILTLLWLAYQRDLSTFIEGESRLIQVAFIFGLYMLLAFGLLLFINQRRQKHHIQEIRDIWYQGIEKNPSLAVLTDATGNIIYVNEKFESITGYSYEEVLGKNPRILQSGDMSEESYEAMWLSLEMEGSWEGEFHNKGKDGINYWVEARISAIKSDKGQIAYYLALQNDLTEKKRLLDKIQKLAMKDPLTGAYNRNIYLDDNGSDQHDGVGVTEATAFLMIDIDHFKQVNDQYGHMVGDQVLGEMAQLLMANIRENDILIRYGGEEFVISIKLPDEALVRKLAERIREQVEETLFVAESKGIHVTVSLGIYFVGEHYQEPIEDLFGRADQALYKAKEAGRNQVVVFNDQ